MTAKAKKTVKKKTNKTPKKVGRPSKFASAKELQEKIDAYFQKCRENKSEVLNKQGEIVEIKDPLIPSIAELAYELGMDRQTFYNYKEKDEFFDTIKKARDYIISQIEKKSLNTNGNIVGTIFMAKNYGYTDKQEVEIEAKNLILDL